MRMNLPPMPSVPGTRVVGVSGVHAGEMFRSSDCVAEEVPVAMEYNGISHAVMLATPADLEDFARGFSLTEGIIDAPSDLRDIEVSRSAQGITLQIGIAPACFARLKERRRSLTGRTGCGLCGTDSLADAVRPVAPLRSDAVFQPAAILRAMQDLRQRQALLAWTGATHAAAWCRADGAIELVREDVARHNALDKLVGAMSLASRATTTHPDPGFILITSRVSYEMVNKAAVAGVPLLAAVSGVTALAVEMAQTAGLTLLGFVRGEDFSVYAHAQRIGSASVDDTSHEP